MTAGHAVNLCVEYDRLMGEAREGHARAVIGRNLAAGIGLFVLMAGLVLLGLGIIDFAAFLRGCAVLVLSVVSTWMQHREAQGWQRIIEGDL